MNGDQAISTSRRRGTDGGTRPAYPLGHAEEELARLVLMYLPEPAAALRRLCGHPRPGGTVVMQEMAMPLARCVPEGPLFSRARAWVLDAFSRAGFECDMGSKLHATGAAEEVVVPRSAVDQVVEGGAAHEVVALQGIDFIGLQRRADIEDVR